MYLITLINVFVACIGVRVKRQLTERETMSDLVESGYSDGGTLQAVQLLRAVKSEPLVNI